LVADDDADICRLSSAALRQQGYEVSTVADGAAAWAALNHQRFDLLITDNSMPELTGIELLHRMRAGRVPLAAILVSGTLPKEEYPCAPWLHPAAILLKPYTPGDLLALVDTVLRVTIGFREQTGAIPEWQRPQAVPPADIGSAGLGAIPSPDQEST
jgi:twitching motility two-component system response regulator PilH